MPFGPICLSIRHELTYRLARSAYAGEMRCPVSVYVKPGTNMACAKASQLRGGVWAIARCESAGIALRHRYAMSRTDVAYEDQKVPDSDVSLSGSVQQKAVRRLVLT